jgi:Ion channel
MTGDIDNSGSIYASFPADPRERRRVVGRTLLRSLAVTVGLLLLYAFVPVPERFGLGALLGLTVGLVVFVILVGWQIRAIVRAEHPVLRAVEVLAFAVPLLVVVFAFTYLSLSRADSGSFSEHLSRIDAMYYTVSTTCTVGFGGLSGRSRGPAPAVPGGWAGYRLRARGAPCPTQWVDTCSRQRGDQSLLAREAAPTRPVD